MPEQLSDDLKGKRVQLTIANHVSKPTGVVTDINLEKGLIHMSMEKHDPASPTAGGHASGAVAATQDIVVYVSQVESFWILSD